MKQYTMVTFILNSETLTRYFEGNAKLWQINAMTGQSPIIELRRIKGNFKADYVKTNNLYGYTAG